MPLHSTVNSLFMSRSCHGEILSGPDKFVPAVTSGAAMALATTRVSGHLIPMRHTYGESLALRLLTGSNMHQVK